MSCALETVEQLWREWYEGLGPNPSIQSLERRYGTAWRKGDAKWFSRWKAVVEFLRTETERRNVTTAQAVRRLDDFRVSRGMSLLKLCEAIRKGQVRLS